MIMLTKEQVILLHKLIYDRFGGSYGVRDEGLLDSALAAPMQTSADRICMRLIWIRSCSSRLVLFATIRLLTETRG